MLVNKRRVAAVIAISVLALISVLMLGGCKSRTLPGGVKLGDPYDKVMEAALKLDPGATEEDNCIICNYVELYGYDCTLLYYTTESMPLSTVSFFTNDEFCDENDLTKIVSGLTKEYGKPSSSTGNSCLWEFRDLAIMASYDDDISDVTVMFYKPRA